MGIPINSPEQSELEHLKKYRYTLGAQDYFDYVSGIQIPRLIARGSEPMSVTPNLMNRASVLIAQETLDPLEGEWVNEENATKPAYQYAFLFMFSTRELSLRTEIYNRKSADMNEEEKAKLAQRLGESTWRELIFEEVDFGLVSYTLTQMRREELTQGLTNEIYLPDYIREGYDPNEVRKAFHNKLFANMDDIEELVDSVNIVATEENLALINNHLYEQDWSGKPRSALELFMYFQALVNPDYITTTTQAIVEKLLAAYQIDRDSKGRNQLTLDMLETMLFRIGIPINRDLFEPTDITPDFLTEKLAEYIGKHFFALNETFSRNS